ncbi:MAG: hypothetical protein AAGC95_01790 [Pseudomonadota bacterium]
MKDDITHINSSDSQPIITVDYERYAQFLEDTDLSEDQKREFLQTLWNIVVEFVSLGFGVHPLQQAQSACGKLDENPPKPALTAPNALYLDHQFITENFLKAAAPEKASEPEGVK